MKIIKLYLIIVSLVALLASNAIAAAWTGSMSEPENMKKIDGKSFYVITTADELAWFAAQVNGGKTTINAVLANDIVFGAKKTTRTTHPWSPIGVDNNHVFNGIFDGAGHIIYGLYARNLKFTGLVGYLGNDGVLRNLNLRNGLREKNIFMGSDIRIAAFAAQNYGLIKNCFSADSILVNEERYKDSLNANIGSIAGINDGIIEYVQNEGFVKVITFPAPNGYGTPKTIYGGGIVGLNRKTIRNAQNRGSMQIINSTSYNFYGRGTWHIGGISGRNNSEISKCMSEGQMEITSYVRVNYIGGISGTNNKDALIENCIKKTSISFSPAYANGDVFSSNMGGVVGSNSGKVKNSFVIANKIKSTRTIDVGAIIGKNETNASVVANTYFNTDSLSMNSIGFNSGTATNVSGKSTKDMQKDQFAWILNTTNGTESNSGVWTRTTGYPDFANSSNLPIYRIVFNDDGATSNRYTNYKGLATFPENPEPAEGLVFKGWYNSEDIRVKPTTVFSSDQTVNAVYVNATDIYWTINFFNTDVNSTLLETKQYQHGSIVAYEGETPTKETTAKYTYTFKGWNVEPTNAIEDFNYYAVYDSTIRSYSIIFKDYDGSEISSSAFEYGTIPTCSKTPSRTATAKWTYAHKGWKPALDYVTESTAYTATYDSTKVEYKVTFMNGVDIIDEQMVPYGDAAVAPTNVTREGYRFTGWNTSFSKVTENLTVKALFEELTTYIVKVLDGAGTKIDSVKIVEGETYTLPIAPQKDGYTFDAYYNGKTILGVAGDVIPVTANITITAIYTKDPESSSSSVVKSSSSSAKSSSSSQTKSSSSQARSSSSSAPKETVISGKLEQTLEVYDWMDFIIFSGVQNYSRESFNIPFLEITESGTNLTIFGTVPGTYRDLVCNGDKKTDSLKVNGRIYKIELTIKNPNKPCNSALTLASAKKQFSVNTYNRILLISGAKVGELYAIFDMQGRILKKGRVESVNFNIPVALAGNYVVKIGHITQHVQIK